LIVSSAAGSVRSAVFLVGLVLVGTEGFAEPAAADILSPTETKVYFERHGNPVKERVQYSVRCFGYNSPPGSEELLHPKEKGTYTPVEVYSYSADCKTYGCVIHEPYYLNYRMIDSCDLEGTVGGKPFKLPGFAPLPIDFDSCTDREVELRDCTLRVQLPD